VQSALYCASSSRIRDQGDAAAEYRPQKLSVVAGNCPWSSTRLGLLALQDEAAAGEGEVNANASRSEASAREGHRLASAPGPSATSSERIPTQGVEDGRRPLPEQNDSGIYEA